VNGKSKESGQTSLMIRVWGDVKKKGRLGVTTSCRTFFRPKEGSNGKKSPLARGEAQIGNEAQGSGET